MQAPGTMCLRNITAPSHLGNGEFKLQLTAYGADGHLIRTWDSGISSYGAVIRLPVLAKMLGESVDLLRIEPYFEPERSRS